MTLARLCSVHRYIAFHNALVTSENVFGTRYDAVVDWSSVLVGGVIAIVAAIIGGVIGAWAALRVSKVDNAAADRRMREDRAAARHERANLEILILANRMVSDTMIVNINIRNNGLELREVKGDDIRRTQAIAHFASKATQTCFDDLMARWREWTSAADGTALGEARAKVREASDALTEQVSGETD